MTRAGACIQLISTISKVYGKQSSNLTSPSRQKDEQSYQMQQYLQADPTFTERLVQSAPSMKVGKKHGMGGSVKNLKKRVAGLELVIQSSGSSTTWWRVKTYYLNLGSTEGLAALGNRAINKDSFDLALFDLLLLAIQGSTLHNPTY